MLSNFFFSSLLILSLSITAQEVAPTPTKAGPEIAQNVSVISDNLHKYDTDTSSKEEISLSYEEQKKILVILKKIHPRASFGNLKRQLEKHLDNGKVNLTKAEASELYGVMKNEQDSPLLNKVENMALGTTDGLMDGVKQIKKAFASNPLSSMSKEEVKKNLLQQWEGQPIGEVFKQYPLALEFMASMFVDKNAIPSLLSIFEKEKELKYYSFLVIITQFMCALAFFALFRRDRFLTRIFKRAILFFCINGVLVVYFVWRFYPEVSPTLAVLKKIILD